MDKQVKVIHLGRGEVISNWGTYEGSPAVFIEPVVGSAGTPGEKVTEGVQPQIVNDDVSNGGVVIVIHDKAGLDVLLEDFASAIGKQIPKQNEKEVSRRSCNMHNDCDSAGPGAKHCHIEDCEDCFGC